MGRMPDKSKMATDERENFFDKNMKGSGDEKSKEEKLFTLKKWNAVAMWSWDVECDTCAICRVQVMGKYLKFVNY
jgi:RING-box protein 2